MATNFPGPLKIHQSIDLDEGALEIINAAPSTLYAVWVTNKSAGVRYVKIYDAESGTAGDGTPVIVLAVPNGVAPISFTVGAGYGIKFDTGICAGCTTGVAHNDTGAPGANDVIATFFYR